jgi:hypothetical protein
VKATADWQRTGRRSNIIQLLLCGCTAFFALLLAGGAAVSQSPASASQLPFPAQIAAVAESLKDDPKLKKLTPREREHTVEFVVGNMLFVVLHELAHTAVADMRIPVLGREEDAADDFAILTLLKVGSAFTHRVLSEATKGWFFSARRDRNDGEPLAFYDEHSLDQQRAYHIVCLMVGHNPSDIDMIELAGEMQLPDDRRESCKKDFTTSSWSWETALASHQRAAERSRTKIEIAYGEAEGALAPFAQSFRAMRLLETVADRYADELAWPTPFTLEMKSCGFINARWVDETRTLTLCYELAADFAELYNSFNKAPEAKQERKAKVSARSSTRPARPAFRQKTQDRKVANVRSVNISHSARGSATVTGSTFKHAPE